MIALGLCFCMSKMYDKANILRSHVTAGFPAVTYLGSCMRGGGLFEQ